MTTYRIQQGVRALLAFTRTVEVDLATRYLNTSQLALFGQMRRSEQLHSLNVLRDVLTPDEVLGVDLSPTEAADLAIAALLHDVGKTRYPLAIWQKTLAVLVRAFLPAVYRRMSSGNLTNLLHRAFVVAQHHPAWSAELVAKTNPSERALWLIEHHADKGAQWRDHPNGHLLKRLQRADDAN